MAWFYIRPQFLDYYQKCRLKWNPRRNVKLKTRIQSSGGFQQSKRSRWKDAIVCGFFYTNLKAMLCAISVR